MKNKVVIIVGLLLFPLRTFSQELPMITDSINQVVLSYQDQKIAEQLNYPEGIYETKESFINKTPTKLNRIVAKGNHGIKKKLLDTVTHNCYFYYLGSDKKVKNVFAVSYKGVLFFQLLAVLRPKNRNKKDKSQTTNVQNQFVQVY